MEKISNRQYDIEELIVDLLPTDDCSDFMIALFSY